MKPALLTLAAIVGMTGCTTSKNDASTSLTHYDQQVLTAAKNNNFSPNTFITEKSLSSKYCPAQETYYHLQSELGPGLIKTARLCCGEHYCRGTTTGNYYE